jgi:hypothetical protein
MIEAIKQDIPKSPLPSSTGQESLSAHPSYCLESFAHPELLELASAWEVKVKEEKEREREKEKEKEKGEKREHETPQSSSKRARREEGGDGNSLEGKDDDEDGEKSSLHTPSISGMMSPLVWARRQVQPGHPSTMAMGDSSSAALVASPLIQTQASNALTPTLSSPLRGGRLLMGVSPPPEPSTPPLIQQNPSAATANATSANATWRSPPRTTPMASARRVAGGGKDEVAYVYALGGTTPLWRGSRLTGTDANALSPRGEGEGEGGEGEEVGESSPETPHFRSPLTTTWMLSATPHRSFGLAHLSAFWRENAMHENLLLAIYAMLSSTENALTAISYLQSRLPPQLQGFLTEWAEAHPTDDLVMLALEELQDHGWILVKVLDGQLYAQANV